MTEDTGLATDTANTEEDPYADMRDSKMWLEAIKDAEKCHATWNEKCDSIDKLYADLEKLSKTAAHREMQIFWANLEVLKPSIYARPPVPVVTSRFKDRKPINRHASELLERCLVTSFDSEDIHDTMVLVRNDLAMYSRGVSWLRYETDQLKGQKVCYDHLNRRDFVHGKARKWGEVPFVARRSWLSRERMQARFEATSNDAWMKADYREKQGEDDKNEYSHEKKAAVWELWHKEKNVVVWVTEGVETVLDIRPPFLTLDRFWPCPKPAYGTVQPNTLIPVPDFLQYKDQVEEINELTDRISALSEALRLKGFYAAGQEDVGTAIETAMKQQDNNALLIPVPSVAALGGGMKDAIVWLPVKEVADVIAALVQLRKQLIEDVYQITGISDIMRGETDPNETKGAQVLKSQYGSIRIRERQGEMVRIARDMTRISGEIMAENFDPQTMIAMSQYDQVPSQQQIQQQVMQVRQSIVQAAQNPQLVMAAKQKPEIAQQALQQAQQKIAELEGTVTIEQVFQFLQDQRMRPFTLEIETDSTIQPDEDAAKQRTTEFLQALGGAIAQLGPMVEAQPAAAPFAAEVLKFAVGPFRAGRELDASIDDFADQMKKSASQPKPNPEAEKMKAEMQMKQADLQMRQADQQMEMEKARAEFRLEIEKVRAESATAMQQAQADLEKTRAEIVKIMADTRRVDAQAAAASRPKQEAA